MILRPYQEAARAAVYDYLRAREGSPCVVLPTGAGKTPLLAALCRDAVTLWQGRVLVLAHVKELLQQAADKLRSMCPDVAVGLYSAGLGKRQADAPVVVAGIQSVHKRACELGPFDMVLVDEAHLIPPEGDGMYRQLLEEGKVVCPHRRVVGLTATPFRPGTGPICTPEGVLNEVCYEAGVRELIRDGYLCPPVSKAGKAKVDTGALRVVAGDFAAAEVEAAMDQDELVEAACAEVVAETATRHNVLVFAAGVQHAQHVVRVLRANQQLECGLITGQTPAAERDEIIRRFKVGALKYLVNVNVLTTGFDAPNVDAVVLLRPTLSPGLYSQMVGRGLRPHPGKADFLVLDFAGNVLRHGPVDQVRVERRCGPPGEAPAKECPSCQALIAAGYAHCPRCGHAFPPPERQKHDASATATGVLSCDVETTWHPVIDVFYRTHAKRLAPEGAPRTMRVDYRVGDHSFHTEWVCFEHQGYPRQKAEQWWQRRSPDPVPDTAELAVMLADNGALAPPLEVCVRRVAGERFDRVIDCKLGPVPEAVPAGDGAPRLDDQLPF